jgi:orotidine-5'-phosphate decarboxylase
VAELGVTAIVALDVPRLGAALGIVDVLGDACGFYKIGSELFTTEGPQVVEAVMARGKDVFLDLKFHDIPNTVRAAVSSAAGLGVRLLTVHATGGRAMLEAAAEAAETASSATRGQAGCKVLAVSVLTSLDGASLGQVWGRSNVDVGPEVIRLAALARDAGVDGLVCSAHEAGSVRRELGPGFELLVPGIRLEGDPSHDQARVATPRAAAEAGASYIVVGRAVVRAADPRAAMEQVHAELRMGGAATRARA